ncbi:hypothetical protein ABTM48_20715, partial [Acinetobacter baumannii]
VPYQGRPDEIGEIAKAVETFRQGLIEGERLAVEAVQNRLREAAMKAEQAERELQAAEERRRHEEETREVEARRKREMQEAEARA